MDADQIVTASAFGSLRGGEFGAAGHNLLSARRHANLTVDRWASVGFRVARMVAP
jgi:formylglycine-generating enzyme required for sulfatase activity